MTEVKFGTSGLRGRVEDLTNNLSRAYMRAFLQHMAQAHNLQPGSAVLVGRDLRASSPRLAAAICAEIAADGFKAENCGLVPTPALALAALAGAAPAVMITGSHIPEDRNGLKFYRPDGEIDKQDETAIMRRVQAAADQGQAAEALENPALPPEDDRARQAYIKRALDFLPPQALRGLHIGIYQHSSVARDILADIMTGLGAEIIVLHRAEKFIAVDTEALREEDRRLAHNAATEYRLDALISTDGDGDRPLIADEKGEFLPGDIIGILTAYFLQADSVATPVTTTTALEKSGFFSHIYRCRVGSPFVLAAMAAAGEAGGRLIVGFEANGGVLLGSSVPLPQNRVLAALPTRDAVLPILSLLALARQKNLPLSGLRALLPARFTAGDRLQNYPPEAAAQLLAQLAAMAPGAHLAGVSGKVAACNTKDGVRLSFDNGDILHFRASGNAPELRCYSEAASQAGAAALVQAGLALAVKAAA